MSMANTLQAPAADWLTPWLFDPVVGRVVTVVVGLLIIIAAVRITRRAVSGRVRDTDMRYRARKLISFLGYVAAFLFLTVVFRGQLGGLTVAFGVAGAGIAFALQEVIVSIAGWIGIAFGGFFKVGDRVQLAGIRGDVIDIGILRSTLMECGQWVNGDLYNGRIVRVANSYVFKEPVFNYSADFPFLWDEITVPIRYGADVETARHLIASVLDREVGAYAQSAGARWAEMVRKYRIEDASVRPLVTLVLTDNWMEFTGRYVVNYRTRRSVKDQIFTQLMMELHKTDGAVQLASATYELTQAPPIHVQVTSGSATPA